MTDIWPAVHAERKALADDLANISDEQWHRPTECPAWDVHDLVAHLVSAATMTPPKFVARMATSGFNFAKYADREVRRERSGGPDATLQRFNEVLTSTSAPPGPKQTWLGEVIVHSDDIRRAAGISHTYRTEDLATVLGFYASSNPIIHGKDRVAGLTLAANDADVSIGSGPVVSGPLLALVRASTGRKSALDELSGPGLDTLRERISSPK